MMKPSVNHMVHYVSYGTPGGEYPSVCRAAVITEVHPAQVDKLLGPIVPETVALCVINPTGLFFPQHIRYASVDESAPTVERIPGTWHWAERVE
jgi:hypothetical protein